MDQRIILVIIEIVYITIHSSPIECVKSLYEDIDSISFLIELSHHYLENPNISFSILKIFNDILLHSENYNIDKISQLVNEIFSFWLIKDLRKYLKHEIFENCLSLENTEIFINYCFRSDIPYWILKGSKLLLNFIQKFDSSSALNLIHKSFNSEKILLDVIIEHLITSNRASVLAMISLW